MRFFWRPLFSASVSISAFLPHQAMCEDRNAEIMKTIYSKIENILGFADPSLPVQHSSFVMAAPGFILDKNLDFNTQAGRGLLIGVMDRGIEPSWMLRFSPYTTSSLYNHILKDKEYAPTDLSDKEKQKLSAAKNLLFLPGTKSDPSLKYSKYQQLQSEYYQAQDTYTTAYNSAQNVTNMQTLALTKAHDAFYNYEFYSDVVGALDDLATLSIKQPSVFWGNLQVLYNANLVPSGTGAGITVPLYTFYPTYKSWMDNSLTWANITISDADESHMQTSSHTSWGGGFSASWGLWRANGNYGQSDGSTLAGFDLKHYNISFDVLRVLIFRPWMDATVFGAPNWRWSAATTQKDPISSGDLGSSPPVGLEPLIPQEVLLARNVKITGDWTTDLKTTYSTQRSGGGGISFGPFSFGASGSSSYDEAKDHNQVTANSIISPDVQIIGMLVDVVPKTPNPDPKLFTTPTIPNFSANASLINERYNDVFKNILANTSKPMP